ncbi:MAG TPA: CAP domain-containing protein [Anaeromyxobacteraceae bacterium]|nr:CAP domain-containing protein [Anaeromyxobacteraceae bacterium]
MHRWHGLLAVAFALFACAAPTREPLALRAGTEPSRPLAFGSYGPEPVAVPSPLERAAIEEGQERIAGRGLAPRTSPALIWAARDLARRAAEGEPDPLSRAHLRTALARALSYDPAPVAHLVVAKASEATSALARTLGESGSFTHLGAGAAVRDGRSYLVLLTARRTALLGSFPREVSVGTSATLLGRLVGLEDPSVHVTAPSGQSRELAARGGGRRDFRAPLRFDVAGRWVVEVIGRGPRGPEVAALLTVSCGGVSIADPTGTVESDPPDPRQAESLVAVALNATRERSGLEPIEFSSELAAVARQHSEAMLARGVLAHILPGSGSAGDRLRHAHLPYAAVLENVARGRSAIAAHRGAEESPAHRQNILAPLVTRMGCGIARGRLPTGEPIVYLTEIFVQPVEDGSEDRMTPEAHVLEAVWGERARLHAPPVTSDPALDDLAREAAREMLRAGEPSDKSLRNRTRALGRKLIGADAFIAAKVSEVTRSLNLRDARFRRVGVGVAIGDSPRYGNGLLWIAVIYTD